MLILSQMVLLATGILSGQGTDRVEGSVKDSLDIPLSFATIIILNKEKEETDLYTLTDQNGFFQLKLPLREDLVYIKANSFGYEPAILPISKAAVGNKPIHFILNPGVKQLKEVVVKSSVLAIAVDKDTVTFRADAFRNNTEKVTEELLKKIPGIEVGKDGLITVNGKQITKILIEGDDLFNNNYRILSRNMSAELVDKIQVIDHYIANPLMKGIIHSDDKVLNITLKNSRKKILFGNAIAGLGNDNRYDLSTNLISFLKSSKIFLFTNFNTVGKDPLPDIGNNSSLEQSLTEKELQQVTSDNLVEIVRFKPGEINRERMNFNKAKLAALSFHHNQTSKLSISGLIYGFLDRTALDQQNSYRYFLNDSTITINENNEYKQSPVIANGYINLVYKPTRSMQLEFTANGGYSSLKTNALLIANKVSKNKGNDRRLYFNQKIVFTKRISDRNVFLMEGFFSDVGKKQQFDVEQDPPGEFPFTNLRYRQLYQSVSYPLTLGKLLSRYISGDSKNNVTFESGWEYKQATLLSSLDTLSDSYNKKLIADTFKNDLHLKQVDAYAGVGMIKTMSPNIKITTQLFAHLMGTQYRNKVQNISSSNSNLFLIAPKVGIRWTKGQSNISLAYSYNAKNPEVTDMAGGYVLSDYRTLQRGATVNQLLGTHLLLAGYTFTNWSKQVIVYMNLINLKSRGNLNTEYELANAYDLISRSPVISTQSTSMLALGISKFIPMLSASVKLKENASQRKFLNKLNGLSGRNVTLLNSNTELSMRTAWKGSFNWHIGFAYEYAKSRMWAVGRPVYFINETFTNFVNLDFKISKRLTALINGEHYYFKAIRQGKKTYLFLDLSVNYTPQESKVSFSLAGKNLLNNKLFAGYEIDDYSTRSQQYRLMPAYLMLEINYRF